MRLLRVAKKSTTKRAGTQPWFVVDKEGLRKTLERKGKAFAIYELLQNGYDEASTKVSVTLTPPVNGRSTLICIDDAPLGYTDLSHAHTMFAESKKKSNEKKRGRFNVGEKHVLALCDSATITSTTGRVIFNQDGTRSQSGTKTKKGTEFRGELSLTREEFDEMTEKVKQVIPPIPTFFNAVQIPIPDVLHEFQATLPTEIADDNGISRKTQRQTAVRLYEPRLGEQSMLYEMGMPVVEIDCKWHVDIQQKVPLNIERDNVTPSYIKAVYAVVLNERKDFLTEEEAAASWVRTGFTDSRIVDSTVETIVEKRYGKKAVIHDRVDKGSNRECASQDYNVVPNGAMSKEEWAVVKRACVMKKAGEVCPTNLEDYTPKKILRDDERNPSQLIYQTFIEKLAPLLINHTVTVRFIADPDVPVQGCTYLWKKGTFRMDVNLAFHEASDWHQNYELLIHEFAHHAVQSNDHLIDEFYETVTDLGAKLARLAQTYPSLFPNPRSLSVEERSTEEKAA